MINKAAVLLVFLCCSSTSVFAAQITLNATWQVFRVSDPNSVLVPPVSVGDTFLSTTVFDSSIIDSDPSALRGFYEHAISSIGFCGNGFCFSSADGSITVRDQGSNGYLFSQSGATDDGITLIANTDLAPSFNDQLTWMETSPLRIDSSNAIIGNADFSIMLAQVGNFQYTIDTPVPAAVWLFGSALMGLAGLQRRTMRRSGFNR